MPYVVLKSAPPLLSDDEILKISRSDTVIGDVVVEDDITSHVFQRVSLEVPEVKKILEMDISCDDVEQEIVDVLSVSQQYVRMTEVMMRNLTPKQEFCFRAYHRTSDDMPVTLKNIAGRLGGVTPERVRQLILVAGRKLSHPALKKYILTGAVPVSWKR